MEKEDGVEGRGKNLAEEQSRSPSGCAARLTLLSMAEAGACQGRSTSGPFVPNKANLNGALICFTLGGWGQGRRDLRDPCSQDQDLGGGVGEPSHQSSPFPRAWHTVNKRFLSSIHSANTSTCARHRPWNREQRIWFLPSRTIHPGVGDDI